MRPKDLNKREREQVSVGLDSEFVVEAKKTADRQRRTLSNLFEIAIYQHFGYMDTDLDGPEEDKGSRR